MANSPIISRVTFMVKSLVSSRVHGVNTCPAVLTKYRILVNGVKPIEKKFKYSTPFSKGKMGSFPLYII